MKTPAWLRTLGHFFIHPIWFYSPLATARLVKADWERNITDNPITEYWLEHYINRHCSLCGNSGVIDTRGARTAAGVHVGRLNFCICPNGQQARRLSHTPLPTSVR